MTNDLDKILEDAQKNGIADDIEQELLRLKLENLDLKDKNTRLQIEKSNSHANQFKKSNANLRAKNKELNEKIKKLKKNKADLAHLSHEDLGVYNRMLLDYESMKEQYNIVFPNKEHPIFNRFNELANQYPNREFIVSLIKDKIKEKKSNVDFQIDVHRKNIKILEDLDKLKQDNPDGWEDEADSRMIYLSKITSIDAINKEIDTLTANKKEMDKWITLKNNIKKKPTNSDIKIKNNLYYEIANEFDRIFDLCQSVGSITRYKATIPVEAWNKPEIYSSLTRELEKQVGLCEEPYTHNFFYSNGEGRLVPYQLNRQFLQYINNNTTFVKYGKTNQYRKGDIISSKVLFEDIPLYCNKIQYRNTNLVGFNNCFYNIETNEIVDLNPQVPIMPLKNTKTELYLSATIENNPMQDIFNQCFTEEDRKTLLAYIGCCLYDKGYTQRQECVFFLGKGGTGKGLDINEWLPSPKGWVQMKNLQVGDELFDEQGNVCNVTYKSPIHNIECYKITFENGFQMIVDKDHKWLTKTDTEKSYKVYDTDTMYNRMQKSSRKRNSFYFAIKTSKPLQLEEKDFIIPPYTLGAWLGDGTSAEGIITNNISDVQIINEIENDGFTTKRTGVDNNLRVYIDGIKSKLYTLGLINNKHIPNEYLRGSYQQRLSLVQGLMDTDGSIDKGQSCEITLKNKQLIEQLQELLFTLGIKSNIKTKQVQLKDWNEPKTYYRLWFKTNLPVFRLKRKLEKIPDYKLRATQYTRYIKNIEPVDSIPTQCIQVDSSNHLFLATKEFIPTHNTTLSKAICSIFYQVGSQLVSKLTDKNQFGFSLWADNDIVIIDEIQSSPKDFGNKFKELSGGQILPVEKKHCDTINIPPENVPHMFFIGNNFSRRLYEESSGEGIKRRMLIVIPTKPIQSLGYNWGELIQPSCQQWLVQNATKEYLAQELHLSSKPIEYSDAEKEKRLEMCTFPEKYFIKEHFQVAYIEGETVDNNERITYDDLYNFVRKCINDNMLEATIKQESTDTFKNVVNKALQLSSNHGTKMVEGVLMFTGIVPKTDEAINYLSD